MEIRKILWPTDFSDNSNAALDYVLSLTKKYGAEIYLLYVAEDLSDYGNWYGELTPDHAEKLRKWEIPQAKKKMDHVCQTELAGCPMFHKLVVVGDPARKILETSAIVYTAARIILYALILVAINQMFFLDAWEDVTQKFREHSWTEYSQVAFIFLIVVIFLLSGRLNKDQKPLSYIIGGVMVMAFIREFDAFLDEFVFDGAWQLLVLLTFIGFSFLVYRHRSGLKASIQGFINQPGFGFFMSGFLTTFVFSRLFGRKVFWQAVMGEDFLRSAKNLAEEGVELLGYALIFFGAVDFFLMAYRHWKAKMSS